LLWNDSDIGVNWPLNLLDFAPLLAAKDKAALTFAQLDFTC
jgi:dTDP-4-dehydrorhamnose 3,5-epimerase-like enzyme